jgi:hypothetical protein
MPEISDKEFARAVLDAGLATPEMVRECAEIQKRQDEMGLMAKSLKDLLVEKGYVADDVARKIGEEAQEAKSREKSVRIGGYEVISRLGKGQMGSVYKARQVSLDRIVALKVLPTRLAGDKRYMQRFMREAKAAGRLNHPNIVTAVEFGESDGLYYYAMDYVEGVNVRDVLEEEGKLSEDEALAVTLQMARALQHAYENNIIHRDVKPENIMVDSEGRARLCDLGLAREANEDGALTQAGIVLGTPYYVSPEQAEGRRDLDTRSDIYSLGVTLYHMVTGQVPFRGNTGPAIMVKHITEKMPDPREFNPDLSNGTVQLIKKMTAKKREQRYQTPEELISDIERVIAGERPEAAGPVIRARKRRAPGAARGQREEVVVAGGGAKKLVPLIAVAAVILIIIVAVASLPQGQDVPVPDMGNTPSGTGDVSDDSGTQRDTPGTGGGSGAVDTRPPDSSGPRLSAEQRQLMDIKKRAGSAANTAGIARELAEFIETAQDRGAIADAEQMLEGLAAREYTALETKFNSLMGAGDVQKAMDEVTAYLKLFKGTKRGKKAEELLSGAGKEREQDIDRRIAAARALAKESKFAEALAAIDEAASAAPEDLKPRVTKARQELTKAKDDYVAAARAQAERTRGDFDRMLADALSRLDLGEAVRLVNERVKDETDPSRIETLKTKAVDLAEAQKGLKLVMANLKNIQGLKQTFDIDGKGDETGTIEDVKETSFIFATEKVVREVRLNALSSDDIIRLAELNLGVEPARARFQLGLLLLLVIDDPQEARRQLEEAGKLGMDTSRFEKKVAASEIEEVLAKAEASEKRKDYFEAAITYSAVLGRMAELQAYATKVAGVREKVKECLEKSGAANAFAGKVSIEDGKLVVTYDFSHPSQWNDFEGYIWSEQLKRTVEFTVENGVLVGKGEEGILWKGKFSGDVILEADVTVKGAEGKGFFIRVCDDGKGYKGKNYSFGFGYRHEVVTGYRRQVVGGKVVAVPQKQLGPPELVITKWKGSASAGKQSSFIQRGLRSPLSGDKTYKLKVERADNKLRASIGGVTVIEGEDKEYKKGGISLKVLDCVVHFDNIRITGDFDKRWLAAELRKAK